MTTEILETGSEPEPLVTGESFTISAPHQLGLVVVSKLASGQYTWTAGATPAPVPGNIQVVLTVPGLYRVEAAVSITLQDGVQTTVEADFSTAQANWQWPQTYPTVGTGASSGAGVFATGTALGWINVVASSADAEADPASIEPGTALTLWASLQPGSAVSVTGGQRGAFAKWLTYLAATLVEGPPIVGGP